MSKIKKNDAYRYEMDVKHLEVRTYHPLIRGVGVHGTLTIFDNFASFVQALKTPHARNKVVFRSKFFSARVTKDGSFSITCHISSEEIANDKIRQNILLQFIRMMTTLLSLTE